MAQPPVLRLPAPRRFVVTGAAGFLGSVVTRHLLSLPWVRQITGVDLLPMTHLPSDERFRAETADVRRLRPGLLDGVDAVLHLAFRLRPSRRESDDRSVNLDATAGLLEGCADTGVRHFIYPSSTTVYGASPGESGRHPESDPLRPVPGFRYAQHKAEAEALIRGFAARHPATAATILRPCVALAPGADNFITDSLQRHLLPVPAGADPEMQFLHAHDLATAVEGVLLRGRGGPYNLAGGGTVRWREVIRLTGGRPLPVPARLLSGLMGLTWRARIQSRSTSAGLALIRYPWLADTTRAETELDWKPQWSSRQAVEAWGASRPVGVT